MKFTYRDSGVFLYTGWRILNGELPYRDIWDHKPPVIFYINAAGLALMNNSRWGVWLIELVLMFFAAWMGYQLIKKLFGLFPAIFSLMLWLLSLVPLFQGGNFTTEYTLPLQFAALWLLYDLDKPEHKDRRFFLIGLTGAIVFFTKQTAIGIWIAIIVYLSIQRLTSGQFKQWFRELSYISLGGISITALMAIFFGMQGAIPQFWSAAFEYNFFYSSLNEYDLKPRIDILIRGLRPLTRTGLLQFSIAGYAAAIIYNLLKKNYADPLRKVLFIGLINLPIELLLIAIPQKTYPHYFMTLLPVLALLTAYTVWMVTSAISNWKLPGFVKVLAAAGILAFFLSRSFDSYLNQLYIYRTLTKDETVVEYVKESTSPDDYVLLWGAEASVNYYTERRSPTRFVYQYPLQRDGYVNENLIVEFLDDVIQSRPKLIIDTDSSIHMYEFPIRSDAIDEKTTYLLSHYCVARRIDSWTVYEYSDGVCAP